MVFLIILSNKDFEDNIGAHMPFIQVSKNRTEDRRLELIKAVRMKNVESSLQEVIINPYH